MIHINKDWRPCNYYVGCSGATNPSDIVAKSGYIIIRLFAINHSNTFETVNEVEFKPGVVCEFKSMYESTINAIYLKSQLKLYRLPSYAKLSVDEDYYLFVDSSRVWTIRSGYILPSEMDKLAGLNIMGHTSNSITVRGNKHVTSYRIENSRLT